MASCWAAGLAGCWGGRVCGPGCPAAFSRFTRQDQAEADYLGLQYMYSAGYDPNGAVSIFEKLESLERTQPGTVARIFSTHPMDETRIRKAEEEISKILPAKDDYVVNTSDYTAIRERLIGQEPRKKGGDDGRPQLKRRGEEAPADLTVRRRDLVE